jgi:hypothetical protein
MDTDDQVRAALGQWLAASGVADRAMLADTAVFVSADGQTARTHVRTRSDDGFVIREQRWHRRADGWSIVDDHASRR